MIETDIGKWYPGIENFNKSEDKKKKSEKDTDTLQKRIDDMDLIK